MSLPTPSQSVSHKWFHQCVNHKKKLSLRHPLPTFGCFSFFQASIWLGVHKVIQNLTKFYEYDLRHLFQCCILIPRRKCPGKTPFQHTVPWHFVARYRESKPRSNFAISIWAEYLFLKLKLLFLGGNKFLSALKKPGSSQVIKILLQIWF